MDLAKMRPGQRLAAKEAYSDASMLTNATQRPDKSSARVVLTPVLAQRKPRGGTVKFTPTAPASPKTSTPGTGLFGFGAKKSGTVLLSGPGSMRSAGRTDSKTVFVPGAMGSLGARIVRELLKSGFRVRAGCTSVNEAQRDLDVGVRYGLIASDQSRNVSFAEVDWSSEESIAAALGNSGKVVFTGDGVPSRACNELIALCEQRNTSQFVMVTSSGGSFFGGSSWKQAQSALESGNMSFTVIQTGNTDRLDSLGTQNIVVGKGTGQMSKLQVAEFVAGCCINEGLAENKVFEIKADPFAENVPIGNLLSQINPVITKEDQMAKQREKQESLDAIAVLVEKAQRLEAEETDCKERVNAFKDKIKDLQAAQKAKQRDAAAMLKSSAQIEKQLTTLTKKANDLDKQEAIARELYTAAQKAGREGQLLSREEQRDIEFAIMNQELIQQREAEEAERKRKQAEVEAAKAKAVQEEKERLAREQKKKEEEQKLADAKAKAEQEAKAKAALEAKVKATAEAQKKAAAAAAAAAQERQRLAAEAKKKEEADRKAAEEKRRMEAKAAEDEKKRLEAEAKAKQEEKKKQEEEKKKLELEAKKKEEAKKAEAAKATAQPGGGLFGFFAPKDETKPPTLTVETEPVDEIRPSAQEWISEWRASQKGEGAGGWYENWIKRQSSSKAK